MPHYQSYQFVIFLNLTLFDLSHFFYSSVTDEYGSQNQKPGIFVEYANFVLIHSATLLFNVKVKFWRLQTG